MATTSHPVSVQCFHCGEECTGNVITAHEKSFCCEGCRMVFEILDKSGMCNYYEISQNPGMAQRIKTRPGKFAFLDTPGIASSLISFRDDTQTHITFYLPQIHCSSCLWLLENLHRLDKNVITSKTNFATKETYIVFDHNKLSLRKLAELLGSIGYEPYLSLNNLQGRKPKVDRSRIYKLGVAGFCFANIMLLSFPEYFGVDMADRQLLLVFRYLNLLLSLPVLFYSTSEFYISAWKSLRQRFLNIDAPIVLAVAVTFGRSVYEVLGDKGGGYFDSMTGIVFFMLIGRVLQNRTYDQLNFDRDYTSYFPVAVTRIKDDAEQIVTLPEIKLDDTLLLHNRELIPADGILTKGRAVVDYSFVTGESIPVVREMGEMLYAGGRQLEANIEMLVIHEVNQGYLTRLWNNTSKEDASSSRRSFVNALSRNFTILLFIIAIATAAYWYVHDSAKILNAVTSILIVACPCALLLSNTFTNGNILRILARNGLYLRNAQAIEEMGRIDHIVSDKTGTLTDTKTSDVAYTGKAITREMKIKIASLASQSTHPLSRAVMQWTGHKKMLPVMAYSEQAGKGIEGIVEGDLISLGSAQFVAGRQENENPGASVYIAIEGRIWGCFTVRNKYRANIPAMLRRLKEKYDLSILSGDNQAEKPFLQAMLGKDIQMCFNQSPEDKLNNIRSLQAKGEKVMMVGDGLNDAAALAQADTGIAVAEDHHTFTPASDGIIRADVLHNLDRYIALCRINKRIVIAAFVVSILYNISGLFFAVQGLLSPMIAAILMPASSLSILLISFGASGIAAKRLKLK